ncbi:MAG TPA: PfkB family carbohydrate kinase [Thermomicrobiales bacterium]|nr:PfkB family carbohydrate kinase [Thermomicrobiales bacterium]
MRNGPVSRSAGQPESNESAVGTSDSRLPTPDYIAYSGLIIDDIVLPDGRTHFNTLGGSGTHALVGMRVWSEHLGYFAAVGSDFSLDHRQQLERLGVDLRGLVERDGYPTARAWQLFETEARRVEVFRTDIEDFYQQEARFEEMPSDYLEARGYHLHVGTLAQKAKLVEKLRAVNPTAPLVWEPNVLQLTGTGDEFHAVLSRVQLVSPDLDEARRMTGQSTAEGMAETFLGWGVPIVALRMGARGSLVATAEGAVHMIPAVPTNVVDTTGAGDAYCGGFLVALGSGLDAAEAGARATVSASFALEQFGVPTFDEQTRVEARRRLAWARERIATRPVSAVP